MNYQQNGNRFFGFVEGSISDMARDCPLFFEGMSILITCLDSTKPVNKLIKWVQSLDEHGYEWEQFDEGIWIPAEQTMRLFTDAVTFYGFDEVYLFKGKPTAKGVRKGVYTSDGYNFAKDVPIDFLDTIGAIGATRYLSDGCGVNFVCESSAVVDLISKSIGKAKPA